MRKPAICFIDSGIGGLSILMEVNQMLPNCDLIYCADKEYFPYGALTDEVIIERVASLANYLENQHHFDILVVACNTASTIVLPKLREILKKPVVGVVPAIKPAAQKSTAKHISLLATEATIKRPYTDQLVEDFAKNVTVDRLGSNKLVSIAEDKLLHGKIDVAELENILRPIIESSSDVIVLACTHFPFLKPEIIKLMGEGKEIVDSGHAIARRVKQLLDETNANFDEKEIPSLYFGATEGIEEYKNLSSNFQHLDNVEFFSISLK